MKCTYCRCELDQNEINVVYMDGKNAQPVHDHCDADIQWLLAPLWPVEKLI